MTAPSDFNKTLEEKVWCELCRDTVRWELCRDTVRCFEQILEAIHHKTTALLPLATNLTNHLSMMVGFFIQWHINLRRLFNAKTIQVKEQWWYYLIHIWGNDKRVQSFSKGIGTKVNAISPLYFELTYIEATVYSFSFYVEVILPLQVRRARPGRQC